MYADLSTRLFWHRSPKILDCLWVCLGVPSMSWKRSSSTLKQSPSAHSYSHVAKVAVEQHYGPFQWLLSSMPETAVENSHGKGTIGVASPAHASRNRGLGVLRRYTR